MGQPVAFGASFQVSTQNANSQDQSALATLRDGRVVVVWKDMGSNSGDIHYRLFNSGGGGVSAEATVNSSTSGLQGRPAVAALAGGGFVVGWESFANDGGGDVAYRTFGSNGLAAMVSEAAVANNTGYQQDISLAGRSGGGFVIGWNEGNTALTGLGGSTAAMLREFNALGSAGAMIRISGDWGGDYGPRLSARGNDLLAAWDDSLGPNTARNGEDGIYSSLITGGLPASSPSGGGTRMDTGPFRESSMDPDVALTGLGSVVVWDDVATGSNGRDIYMAVNGGVSRVNTTTTGTQSQAAIAALGDSGGFVVVWTNETPTGERDIRARLYDAAGHATSTDFRVTEPGARSAGVQYNPDVVALLDGRFMVSWSDENAGQGIVARIFDPRTTGQHWLGGAVGERYYGTSFNDDLRGAGGVDQLFGMAGNDTLNGGAGNDVLDGGLGRDTADYSARTTALQVTLAADSLVNLRMGGVVEDQLRSIESIIGGAASDRMLGDNLANLFRGEGGNDTLDGGYGLDTLTGGSGADEFAFSTPLNPTENLDTITDFSSVADHIALVGGSYAALAGSVQTGELRFGTAAADGNDRLIYDFATGRLWWDADATGAGAARLICRLQPGTLLEAGDFILR